MNYFDIRIMEIEEEIKALEAEKLRLLEEKKKWNPKRIANKIVDEAFAAVTGL